MACLFVRLQENSSSGSPGKNTFRRQKKKKGAAKAKTMTPERETSLREAADVGVWGGGVKEVTHRPVLTERF